MTAVIAGLALALIILIGVQLFARWHAVREERRQRMIEESWAIHRAARQIHDQTATALQAMLDEARTPESTRPKKT